MWLFQFFLLLLLPFFEGKGYLKIIWLNSNSRIFLVFHLSKKISDIFPDSSLLIVVGLILGVLLKLSHVNEQAFSLQANVFFLYLLPPIIFEAGLFLLSCFSVFCLKFSSLRRLTIKFLCVLNIN